MSRRESTIMDFDLEEDEETEAETDTEDAGDEEE